MRAITRGLALGAVAALTTVAACAPGSAPEEQETQAASDVDTDVAAMGDLTLTVWDQEVRGGQNEQMTQLNDAFQAKYPNVTIKRVSRSFDDLQTTLRLALSGNEPPDVVEANNGRSQMGAFVEAGQLVNLDPYAEAYGWDDRYPESVRTYSSYTTDGKTFGEGSLYGLPQVGEVVGVYVNTAKLEAAGVEVPTTWDDFAASLPTLKQAGEVPLMLGNLEKWPAIHVFGTIQAQTTPADQIRKLGFGQEGASWKTEENTEAATTLQDWVKEGYFNDGVNGVDYDPTWQSFSKGTGAYLIAGTWLQADLSAAMGDDVQFILPPGSGDTPVATGGTGLPFSITTKSPHPDAAAAYVDFITNADAMKTLTETDNLPVADTGDQTPPAGLGEDVFTAFSTAAEDNGLVPYLDYATPTFSDTLGAALQDLIAEQSTPEEFLDTLEADYSGFVGN